MSTPDGMPRAAAPAQAKRHLVRRMVVVPAVLGTAIATTVAGSAIAHPSEGTRVIADGAVTAAALATPVAFGGLYAAPSLDPARSAESVAAQAAAARAEAAQVASRAAAERSAISLAEGSKEERERAIAAQERDAAAAREAARAKAKLAAKRLAAAHRWVLPLEHPVLTSHFGMRWGRLHAGIDFGTPVGTSVFAMSTGVVTKTGNGGGYGNKIEITYWNGTVSYFAHLSEIDVKVGQKVRPGTYVGKSGNTGHSTGPHLHLEIHPAGGDPIDPLPWLKKHGINVPGV